MAGDSVRSARQARAVHPSYIGNGNMERFIMNNAGTISSRFVWTAAILPFEPDHRVLEVGPGLAAGTGSRSGSSRSA